MCNLVEVAQTGCAGRAEITECATVQPAPPPYRVAQLRGGAPRIGSRVPECLG